MPALPPGGLPPNTTATTLVAFGAFTAPGMTTATPAVTGPAEVFVWGTWGRGLSIRVERSVDGGTTWATSAIRGFDPPGLETADLFVLNRDAADRGTAIYRLGLSATGALGPTDDPLHGVTLNWAIYR